MKYRLLTAILSISIIGFSIWLGNTNYSASVEAANINLFISVVPSITTVPPSILTNSTNESNNSNLFITVIALISAIIGAVAVIGAAFISGWLPNYLEQRKKVREKNRQENEREIEAAKALVAQAKNIKDRVRGYRRAIQVDPRISTLQILDMNKPLLIANVYVRLRLHQESRSGYKINADLLEAEAKSDPDNLLKAEQVYLEKRISMALDPEAAILQYRRCIIVGDPGAGKTTLLKYLALKSASGQIINLPNLPIHIELNAFSTSNSSDLLEFASEIWQNRYKFPKDEALSYIKRSLEEGNAILLLDALDETVIGNTTEESENSYNKTIALITNLAALYHQVPIVVTVRKAGYHQRAVRLQGFTELEVLDFRPEDIRQFIDQWFYDKKLQTNAGDLKQRLERNSRLLTLATNPLLLSLITIVYEAQLDLPDRRTELYKQCIDILLTKWDANRNIIRRREFKPEHKKQLLQEVAWYFHSRGQRYFSDSELLTVISDFLPIIGLPKEQNASVLREIAAENGLLKEQAYGWHGFLHLTLQEYFAAQYINDHNCIDEVLLQRHKPWWEEVVLLYAGLTPDASFLIKELLDGDTKSSIEIDYRTNLASSDLLLASRTLIARPTIRQIQLRAEVLKRLFHTLIKTGRSDLRQIVAEHLVDIGGKEVNDHIVYLLISKQTNLGIRQCLVYALIRQKKYFAMRELLQLVCNFNTDESLRNTIMYTVSTVDIAIVRFTLGDAARRLVVPRWLQEASKLPKNTDQAPAINGFIQFLKLLQ